MPPFKIQNLSLHSNTV